MANLHRGGYAEVSIAVQAAGAELQVSSFAGDETFPAPVTLWLPPGEHVLEITAAGYESAKQTILVGGEADRSIVITLVAKPAAGDTRPGPPPAASRAASPRTTSPSAAVDTGQKAAVHVRPVSPRHPWPSPVAVADRTVVKPSRSAAIGAGILGTVALGAASASYLYARSRASHRRAVRRRGADHPERNWMGGGPGDQSQPSRNARGGALVVGNRSATASAGPRDPWLPVLLARTPTVKLENFDITKIIYTTVIWSEK